MVLLNRSQAGKPGTEANSTCCADVKHSRVFQASVCMATYGMSVPSLHTESTDSVIHVHVAIPTEFMYM